LCSDPTYSVTPRASIQVRMTKAIICGALVRNDQNILRFAQLLELFFGVGVVLIFIWMKLNRQLAIGAFHLLVGGVSFNAQHFVVITFLSSHITDKSECD